VVRRSERQKAGGGRERTPKNLGAQVIVSRAPWMAGTSPAMTVAGGLPPALPPKQKSDIFFRIPEFRAILRLFKSSVAERRKGKADMDTETALKPARPRLNPFTKAERGLRGLPGIRGLR
jgi:hypothetical protein